ncbi:MAG: DUF4410 domain-containing protein [Candidatus Omnitrophica bacterium]|nr:DUF4410 domain-containing protein [Candidatus Omnitrophota bacterium]
MEKIFLISILLLTGCAHVYKSEFLKDYSTLTKGKYLEKVFISPDLKPSEKMVIKIEKPDITGAQANDSLPPDMARDALSHLLEQKLGRLYGIKIASASDTPTHVLETAITDLEPGSRFLRWIIGWGLAGSSKVQVEGRILDASGKPVVIFADRRAGSAVGGYDLTGGDPRALLENDMEGIAQALADTLQDEMVAIKG